MKSYYCMLFCLTMAAFPVVTKTQDCKDECEKPGIYYQHTCDGSCSGYIWCVNGIVYAMQCGQATFWDNNLSICSSSSSTCKGSICGEFDVDNGQSEPADNPRQGKYTCDAGYMPRISEFVLECPIENHNFEWNEAPPNLCITKSDCGSLPTVTNGGYEMAGAGSTTATPRCNDGSKVEKGTPDIECVDGDWVGGTSDFCVKGCVRWCVGEADGYYASCNSREYYIICTNEYTYEMPCGATQHWDDEKGKCDVIQNVCESVPDAENGFFVKDGDDAVINCNSGFKPRTAGYKVYCVAGQWDLPTPAVDYCLPVTCDDPPETNNGWFEVQDDGSTAVLQCDDGYSSPTEDFTIECVDGQWPEDVDDICVEVTCGDPPETNNGWFEVQDDDETTAVLQCDDGYSSPAEDFTIECVDGQWPEDVDDICVEDVACEPLPEVDNGSFEYDDDYGKAATLQCDEKYRPAQNYTIKCDKDGKWPTIPDNICIPEFNSTAKGKTFVLTWFEKFNKYKNGGSNISIFMTSSETANVNITSPLSLGDTPTSFTFSGTKMLDVDADTFLQMGTGASKKMLRVSSDVDINVYSYIDQQVTSTASIIHPTDSLGTEYILVTGPVNPSYSIIALEDFTKFEITYPNGTQINRALRADMVLYFNRLGVFDFTGTLIKSDKPIAVFSGNKCTRIPWYVAACDTLIEQLPTIASLQYVYILSFMYPRRSFRLQVVIPHDNTEIEIGNSSDPDSIMMVKNKGENLILDLDNRDTIYVKGSKPIMVVKYSHGNEYDNVSVGDPCVMIMPGVGQFEHEYFYTSIGSLRYEKVYIIIKKQDRDGLRLNGKPVTPGKDNPPEININVPLYGDYCIVYFDVGEGTQHLTHVDNKQFGAVQYGAAMYIQYGYALGYKMRSNSLEEIY